MLTWDASVPSLVSPPPISRLVHDKNSEYFTEMGKGYLDTGERAAGNHTACGQLAWLLVCFLFPLTQSLQGRDIRAKAPWGPAMDSCPDDAASPGGELSPDWQEGGPVFPGCPKHGGLVDGGGDNKGVPGGGGSVYTGLWHWVGLKPWCPH